MTLEQHEQLREDIILYKAQNGINLPRGYNKNPHQNTQFKDKSKALRLEHLKGLIEIYYNQLRANPSIFQCSRNNYGTSTIQFEHYILKSIINKYRFGDIQANEIHFEQDEIQEWYDGLLKLEGNKPTGKPILDFSSLQSWEEGFDQCQHIYTQRMDNLGQILHYLHTISDSLDELEVPNLYGVEKSALRSWIGQELIRCYPYIDIPFSSTRGYRRESDRKIGEHWTPLMMFRDIIMVRNSNEFGQESWSDVLRFQYRFVNVSRGENMRLDAHGFKSVRPFNAYEIADIEIHSSQVDLWNRIYESQLD